MWFDNSSQHAKFSISGWRFNFTNSPSKTEISIDDITTVYYGITAYVNAKILNKPTPLTISIGCDTRSTSPVLLYLVQSTLKSLNCKTINLGALPLPAITAHTSMHSDGFIYITASHNPAEYNGIKFGSSSGRVQSPSEHNAMMEIFSSYVSQYPHIPKVVLEYSHLIVDDLASIYSNVIKSIDNNSYVQACEEYRKTVYASVFKDLHSPQLDFKRRRKQYIKSLRTILSQKNITKLGVILDVNGGARTWDFDRTLLEELDIEVYFMNNTPGTFTHAILPEGEALSEANDLLLSLNKNPDDTYWLCAIVFDCDGDRGNTIYHKYHNNVHNTTILSPQEVFSVALTIELAWVNYQNRINNALDPTVAFVVNGPSSLRCDVIAQKNRASIFRSEVGEANVVELSENIRKKGINVPIIGEASNGGTILYPSTVRDPLGALLSLLKGILWAKDLQLPEQLPDILATIPKGFTTASEDIQAKIVLPDKPYSEIVSVILQKFPQHLSLFIATFAHFGITIMDYAFVNFCGANMRTFEKDKIDTKIDSGGIAIYFYTNAYTPDAKNTPLAFVWLRPSGTEPVVRIMADVLHDEGAQIERALISEWRQFLGRVIGT